MINDIDFTYFKNSFLCTSTKERENVDIKLPKDLHEVVGILGGISYDNGVVTIYDEKDITIFTQMVERAFPQAKDKIYCFGRDWLNRQFAVINYKPYTVLRFDINYKSIGHIDVDMKSFFEEELIVNCNDLCAKEYFLKWGNFLKYSECAGYIVPLFLGGEDNIENLQIIDAEVDLELTIQLIESISTKKE